LESGVPVRIEDLAKVLTEDSSFSSEQPTWLVILCDATRIWATSSKYKVTSDEPMSTSEEAAPEVKAKATEKAKAPKRVKA
jgi:hypothetical protein